MKFRKLCLLTALIITFGSKYSIAAENITIETKTDNFFENFVSDTILLLDPDLEKIIADDFTHVVNESKFTLQVNSWKPRPNPKIRLENIYSDINSNNIKMSFASIVQPIVEIACTPQQYDPMNQVTSKCIKEMFKYPIISTMKITYSYKPQNSIAHYISELSSLNDDNRYQQMVRTTADIMNSAFEKSRMKSVTKNVTVVKYPLQLVQGGYGENSTENSNSVNSNNMSKADLEKQRLKSKRDALNSGAFARSSGSSVSKNQIDQRLNQLEKDPDQYFYDQARRDAEKPIIVNPVVIH